MASRDRLKDELSQTPREELPNTFLIGAPKAGTSWLSKVLGAHPDVFVPIIKEPNLLCISNDGKFVRNGGSPTAAQLPELATVESLEAVMHSHSVRVCKDYRKLYEQHSLTPIRLDASVRYLYSREARERLASWPGGTPRFLVLLREPVRRAWSQWQMNRRMGIEPLTFDAAIRAEERGLRKAWSCDWDYRDHSRYQLHLSSYFEAFGRSSFHIEIAEEMFADPQSSLTRIANFLQIDPTRLDPQQKQVNVADQVRSRKMEQFVHYYRPGWREFIPKSWRSKAWKLLGRVNVGSQSDDLQQSLSKQLESEFGADIQAIAQLLHRDLPWQKDERSVAVQQD